jgi:cation diffusion facilitator family transporter
MRDHDHHRADESRMDSHHRHSYGYESTHPHSHAEAPTHVHPHELDSVEGRVHDRDQAGGFPSRFFRRHSHDASDSLDDALAGSSEGIRTVQISLVVLGATAILQLMVVIMSGSVALFADTIHNVADAATAIPLWIAFSLSRRQPNDRYTYGYGRAEDLAGVFVVGVIAVSAAVASWESIQRLLHPQAIDNLGWVCAAAVVGFVGNEIVARYRIRTGERIGSAALVADGYHARTDGFTSVAVLFGGLGAWLGFPQADPLVGLGITAAIAILLKDAAFRIWHRLMDAVDPALLQRVRSAAASADGVESVSQVRARWIGHTIHAEVLLTASSGLPLNQAHAVAERARHAMLHAVPKLTSVTVHVDPHSVGGHDHHADLAHHDRASS